MAATNNIPALRFPEFSGEWGQAMLFKAGISVIDGDRGTNYPNGDDFSETGYCLFLNAKNVTKSGFSFEEQMFISKEKDQLLSKGKLKRYDLVLTTRGSIGHVAYYDNLVKFDNIRINSGMVIIRTDNSKVKPEYLYLSFYTPDIVKEIKKISFGSAQPQLTVKGIKKLHISFPTLPEQEKVASFLTAVDSKVQQLTKKVELLQQYKKGAMQQLFSQQIRFKNDDGTQYPDWEEKRLGEVAEITTGSSNRVDSNLDGEYTFFDRSQDIRSSNMYLFDAEAVIVAGEGQEFIPKYFIGKFDLHQRTYAIMNFIEANGKYVYYTLCVKTQYLLSQAVGSTVKSLRLPMFQKMPIYLPCLEEQQKIASFLSAIDDKINQVQTQLQRAQQFKKGLLQQMFV